MSPVNMLLVLQEHLKQSELSFIFRLQVIHGLNTVYFSGIFLSVFFTLFGNYISWSFFSYMVINLVLFAYVVIILHIFWYSYNTDRKKRTIGKDL